MSFGQITSLIIFLRISTFQTEMVSTAALNKEAFWFTRQGDASTACKQTRDFMNFYFATVASKECPFPTVTGDTADKGIELGVVVIADVTQNLDHVTRWYVCVSLDNEM